MGHAALSMADPEQLTVEIWRGRDEGRFQTYEVPSSPKQTVLDLVTWVQRKLDPTLAYRFACRVGMCGSCAMTVNGRPRWTCRSHVALVAEHGRVRLEPLRNLPRVKDLVVDMQPFFDRWRDAGGRFVARQEQLDDFAKVEPASSERRAADAGIECIGCGVCHAACDVVAWSPAYLGPAGLNRAWTLQNDVRDDARGERLALVAGDAGCHACHSHQACTEACPKHLAPTASIAGLKRQAFLAALKGEL
jgi:fumarate reductase iron-sulfur subunit